MAFETLAMVAGSGGGSEGYETGAYGTLIPDNPFGYTINELSEGPTAGNVMLVVEGIVAQTIFETIEIDGVTLTMLSADTFVTGSGVSTWTFVGTALTLVDTTEYDVIVKRGA
jgi:hypothetical protein